MARCDSERRYRQGVSVGPKMMFQFIEDRKTCVFKDIRVKAIQ